MTKKVVLVLLVLDVISACNKSKDGSGSAPAGSTASEYTSTILANIVAQGEWKSSCFNEGSQSAQYQVKLTDNKSVMRSKTIFQDKFCSTPYLSENLKGNYEVLSEDSTTRTLSLKIKFQSSGNIPLTEAAVHDFNTNYKLGCEYQDWQQNQDRPCDLFAGYEFEITLKQGQDGIEVEGASSHLSLHSQKRGLWVLQHSEKK